MLSSKEIERCGGVRAALEVRRACRKLTTLFGWREDPPSPLFHAVNGELGLFVWDGDLATSSSATSSMMKVMAIMKSEGIKIRFLVRKGNYEIVDRAHVEPILEHLEGGEIAYGPTSEALNVSLSWEVFPKADVFLSHGLADKNWRNADKMSGYGYILVSGPAWKEKLIGQGISPDAISVVGYPFLDPVSDLERSRELLVWAPTHKATSEVTTEGRFSEALVDRLGKEFPLEIVSHPVGSKRLSRDVLPRAAVVIADAGSTLYEAWAFGIPVVFPDWLVKEAVLKKWPGSFEAAIYERGLGWHANSEGELIDLVREVWKTGELGTGVEEFMEGILPSELRGCSGEVAAKELTRLLDRKGGGKR